MNAHNHAVVWIDHVDAKVLNISDEAQTKVVVNSHLSVQRLHHKNLAQETGNPPVDTQFFVRIVGAVEHAQAIVIAGPGDAKIAFEGYLLKKRPDLAGHVHRLETASQPDDAGLIALARTALAIEA